MVPYWTVCLRNFLNTSCIVQNLLYYSPLLHVIFHFPTSRLSFFCLTLLISLLLYSVLPSSTPLPHFTPNQQKYTLPTNYFLIPSFSHYCTSFLPFFFLPSTHSLPISSFLLLPFPISLSPFSPPVPISFSPFSPTIPNFFLLILPLLPYRNWLQYTSQGLGPRSM